MNSDRFIKAKIQMLVDQPFYGQLASYLVPVVDDKRCPTMGVNQLGELFVNSKWVDALPFPQLKGVLMHEILHLVFLHPSRYRDFDRDLFNIAADLKINDILLNDQNYRADLPDGPCRPDYMHSWQYKINKKTIEIKSIDQKTTEQIYYELRKAIPQEKIKFRADLILSQAKGDPNKSKGKSKQIGNSKEEITSEKMQAAKDAWTDRVNAVKMQGLLPGEIDRALNKLRAHKITWNSWLHGRFARLIKERTWSRPSKRWLPWYFPASTKVSGLRCVVGVDTSGSISDKEYSEIISELYGIYVDYRGAVEMIILGCDSEIHNVYNLKDHEEEELKKIKLSGGGGTDFRPVFKWIKIKLRQPVDCLIYFTDGYGDFPTTKNLPFEVIWVITSDIVPPFGKRLSLK